VSLSRKPVTYPALFQNTALVNVASCSWWSAPDPVRDLITHEGQVVYSDRFRTQLVLPVQDVETALQLIQEAGNG
jgi:hypothetical protein